MHKYQIVIASHPGLLRAENQDNYFCNSHYREPDRQKMLLQGTLSTDKYLLAAVFDGMGGLQNGARASLLAAQTTEKWFLSGRFSDRKEKRVEDLILQMNRRICGECTGSSGRMGSTCVILEGQGEYLKIYNIGDSRAYYCRDHQLIQISEDHTVLRERIKMGNVKLSGTGNPIGKHTLTQYLGIDESEFIIEPHESESIQLKSNEIILLCSDGLTDMLSDEEILFVLEQDRSLKEKRDCLLDKALQAGGKDNITMLMLEKTRGIGNDKE